MSENIQLFPNPTTDAFTVNGLTTKTTLEIVNSLGQLVKWIETSNVEENVNCSELPSGIYFLKITSGTSSVTKKFIKE